MRVKADQHSGHIRVLELLEEQFLAAMHKLYKLETPQTLQLIHFQAVNVVAERRRAGIAHREHQAAHQRRHHQHDQWAGGLHILVDQRQHSPAAVFRLEHQGRD